jgi:dihydrolipoamide dehydrogenase
MPSEITMPQLSDTMTEGTLIKWNKKEGDKVSAGDQVAEVETDKANMPMEAFESGTLAALLVKEGDKIPVGGVLGVIATSGEKPAEIKKQYADKAQGAGKGGKPAKPVRTPPPAQTAAQKPAAPAPTSVAKPTASAAQSAKSYQYDLIVIGGGPAGYAAAIRAGQLKKRVLCIEGENLGGTCLNWGCIPTKALLEDGQFIRRLNSEAAGRGITFDNLKFDFSKMIARSRAIADRLQKGVAHLFNKYNVKTEKGHGQLLAPHKVRLTADGQVKEITADHVLIAVGAKPNPLPGAPFDGQSVIGYREAMTLKQLPKRLAIVGSGAIGCEFADFYNALGTEVTIIEMLPQLLPNEDEDVSLLLRRIFEKRGVKIFLKTKTEKVEKAGEGVRLTLKGEDNKTQTLEADAVLVAVGVTGNTDGLLGENCKLELDRKRIKTTPDYRTNLENVWATGDCVALHFPAESSMAGYRHPDLAHVAHHEAVYCVERMFGFSDHKIDYRHIPGCTYTHPQVASMGMSEKKARDAKREIRIGKFPFSASGRALAAGETEGFVKLIFDARYGELLGVHMIGEGVTELLAELVLARKLEATEAEIIEAMHPHPTLSEAVMEAAGVADGRAIHL